MCLSDYVCVCVCGHLPSEDDGCCVTPSVNDSPSAVKGHSELRNQGAVCFLFEESDGGV